MLTRRITTFRQAGSSSASYRRHDEVHIQHLFRAAEVLDELRKLGFRSRVPRSYGSFRLPGQRAVIQVRGPAGLIFRCAGLNSKNGSLGNRSVAER